MNSIELFVMQLLAFSTAGLLFERFWKGFSWIPFTIGFVGMTLIRWLRG
jgi:hypothetical protein